MLKKLRELFTQKGQGTVEYALILGFIAIIAVYMLTGSGLKDTAKSNVDNAKAVGDSLKTEFTSASSKS